MTFFFKQYRRVEHRDETNPIKLAKMKKSIYCLPAQQDLLMADNRRYLQFISAIDDVQAGIVKLDKIPQTVVDNDRPYKGFNLFTVEGKKFLRITV